MQIKNFALLLIIGLAFFLRFLELSVLPGVLNRDEAALAYNAYLLKETGRDEWQVSWPLTLKSFGDYKLPGYPYLLAGLFNFLPLSDLLVRLPSALAGVFLVVLAYFFAINILKVRQISALIMSLLVAISPVFFFYSRIAFEANLALLLFTLAIYFFLHPQSRPILAGLLLFLAVLTYNTPLLLLPFLIPVLIFHHNPKQLKKWLLPTLILLLIFAFGLINFFALASQKSAITIFSDQGVWEAYAAYRSNFAGVWQTLLGNRYVFYAQLIWQNLVQSFSIHFLVQNGGSHPWHSLPGYGHLFYSVYFLAVFMLVDFLGELVIFIFDRNYKLTKNHLIWLYLTLAALAPSVVTVDSPHATRSLFFFFMLLCLATLFFDKLLRIFPDKKMFFSLIFLGLLLLEGGIYFKSYFGNYQKQQPESLYVKYPEYLKAAAAKHPEQATAVIDGGGYQYILTAWYLRVPAAEFFATMKYQDRDNINFHYGEALLNYRFIKDVSDRSEQEKVVIDPKLGITTYE